MTQKSLKSLNPRTGEVIDTIDPDRLLVFDAAQGWDPLCDFLELPVPDLPYPSANSSKEFWEPDS